MIIMTAFYVIILDAVISFFLLLFTNQMLQHHVQMFWMKCCWASSCWQWTWIQRCVCPTSSVCVAVSVWKRERWINPTTIIKAKNIRHWRIELWNDVAGLNEAMVRTLEQLLYFPINRLHLVLWVDGYWPVN